MPPKPSPTHFLCIPLVTATSRPQLVRSLASLTEDVTSPGSTMAVPVAAIRPVGTLHLTLGIMSYPRNEGLDRAVELLRSLRPREMLASIASRVMLLMPGQEASKSDSKAGEVRAEDMPSESAAVGSGSAVPVGSDTNPEDISLLISLRGLHSMQPQLAAASVLYAPPTDRLGILQAFCEKVRLAFLEAKLLVEDDRPLLLHATIVNTIYVRSARDRNSRGGGGRAGRGGRGGWNDRLTVDARDMVDRYEDHIWMEDVRAEKLAICKMGARKIEVDGMEDEAYEIVAEIDL